MLPKTHLRSEKKEEKRGILARIIPIAIYLTLSAILLGMLVQGPVDAYIKNDTTFIADKLPVQGKNILRVIFLVN